MPVTTPISLSKIATEFGGVLLSSNTANTGSGTFTAPAGATSATIYVWGGGGGGWSDLDLSFGGGAGGGFTLKTVTVTGGSTQFSYSVGAGGSGGADGGTSTVTSASPSVSLTATGGGGANVSGGSVEGTGSGGDVNYSGFDAVGTDGGAAGGSGLGGQTNYGGGGYAAGTYNGFAPGGGGSGDDSGYGVGANGRVKIEWRKTALSGYTRGGGVVPNHVGNISVPASTTGLSILNFRGINSGTQELYSSGSATITADPSAQILRIRAWGGGGGGGSALIGGPGGGGGGGSYSEKIVAVTGGATQFTYSIGAGGSGGTGGNGGNGGTTTVDQVGGSRLVTANGGAGGSAGYPGNGGAGGTAANGEINISGTAGNNGITIYSGGDGGSGAGGEAGGVGGVENPGVAGTFPGGGGGGGGILESTAYSGGNGASGRVVFEWYAYENAKPFFRGAELNYSTTINVGSNGEGYYNGSYGYYKNLFGGAPSGDIRGMIGTQKNSFNSVDLIAFYEDGIPYYIGPNFIKYIFYIYFIVSGNKTIGALGYPFFSRLDLTSGSSFVSLSLERTGSQIANGTYQSAGNITYWYWDTLSVNQIRVLPDSGSYNIKVVNF